MDKKLSKAVSLTDSPSRKLARAGRQSGSYSRFCLAECPMLICVTGDQRWQQQGRVLRLTVLAPGEGVLRSDYAVSVRRQTVRPYRYRFYTLAVVTLWTVQLQLGCRVRCKSFEAFAH